MRRATPVNEGATPGGTVARPLRRQMFAALDETTFRLLWFGMLPSVLAMQMGQIAVGYVAYRISGSATALGLIAAGWGIPMLICAPIGGVIADRARKRTVLFFTQSTLGLTAVINAILVLTGTIQIWHLIAISVMQGVAFAFNMPSRQAMIAEIVSQDNLMNAIALNNAGMNLARVVGPAIAGALIGVAFVGAGGIFVVMSVMYVMAVLLLFRLPKGKLGVRTRSGLDELVRGVRYVRNEPVLRLLLALALVPVLLGMPYVQMMPVFALDVFDVGSEGLGILMAVNGLGALCGSLFIASATAVTRKGLLQLSLGLTFGLALAVFAFGRSFPVGLLTIAIIGGASASYSTLNSTLIMLHTDRQYYGRVMSLYMMTFSMMPLGSVPLAWLVDQFGAPVTVGFSGLLLALIVGTFAAGSPTYRKL